MRGGQRHGASIYRQDRATRTPPLHLAPHHAPYHPPSHVYPTPTDTRKERDNAALLSSLPSTHRMRTMSGCCRQECVLRCSDLSPHYDTAACAYELDWCARYYAPAAHDRFVDPDTANAYMAAYGSRDIPMADTVAAANTTAALTGGPAPLITAPYTTTSTAAPTTPAPTTVVYTYTDSHGAPMRSYTTVGTSVANVNVNANAYIPYTTSTSSPIHTYRASNGNTYTPGRTLRGGHAVYGAAGNGARAVPVFRSVRRVY